MDSPTSNSTATRQSVDLFTSSYNRLIDHNRDNRSNEVLANQHQQSDMYQRHQHQTGTQLKDRMSQPLLFSIDYILNLAASEHQQHQSTFPHRYLSQQLAQIQQFQQHQQHQWQQHQHQHKVPHESGGQRRAAQDCRKKKTRTVFTKPQVAHFESVFRLKKYLTCIERSQLASSMNLSENQIKIWFQNRRNKFKREHHIAHLGLTSHPVFSLGDHTDDKMNKNLLEP